MTVMGLCSAACLAAGCSTGPEAPTPTNARIALVGGAAVAEDQPDPSAGTGVSSAPSTSATAAGTSGAASPAPEQSRRRTVPANPTVQPPDPGTAPATQPTAPPAVPGNTPAPASTTAPVGTTASAGTAAGTAPDAPQPPPPTATATSAPPAANTDPCRLDFRGAAGDLRAGHIETPAGLGCADAAVVLTTYLGTADPGTGGNTKTTDVSGWTCQTPTAEGERESGVRAACSRNTLTIVLRGV